MKTKILTIAILYVFTLTALFTWPLSATVTAQKTGTVIETAMPNVSGEAAKDFLKRDGSYDRLVEAVQRAGGNNEAGAIQEFSQTKKLLASDGGGSEFFGRTIALSGDTAVVSSLKPPNGPNLQQGAVYVFERNWGGANAWGEVKKLIAADGEMNERFGFGLAISGDTIVVGKERELVSGAPAPGGAYIYERHRGGPNNWGLVKRISASDATGPNSFGVSISISGSTMAVGATQDTIDGVVRGSVYIYERDSGGADNWGETKKIIPSDGTQLDSFGAVALSGENLIVGALGADVGGNENQGAAYIFRRDAGGANNWGEVKKLVAPDGAVNGVFGKSVGISGSTAIVCAGLFSPSAVYVFERDAGGLNNWGQVKKLTTDHAGQGASSVASIDGDRIVIGEPQEVTGTSPFPGAAYLFERNNGGAGNWGRVKKLAATPESQVVALNFGNAVAVSGKTILIGAQGESTLTGIQQRGAAYLFQTETQTWIQQSKPLPASCTVDDRFGWSVSISGDTAIVGAPYADVGSNANQGAAYILERDQGGAGAWGLVRVITHSFGEAEDLFGWSVALSGDKAIVGSPLDDSPTSVNTGSVHVFERNTGGVNAWAPILILFDGLFEQHLQLGMSVDIDGDVAVAGRPGDDISGIPNRGSATVLVFSGTTLTGGKIITASDGAANDNFGSGVAVSGDTIVVGASFKSSYQGAGYVFERSTGGADNWGEVKKVNGDGTGSLFGHKVAISGDTIVVGTLIGIAPNNAAYVFARNSGGANNWGRVKKLTRPGSAANGLFGSAVAIEGEKIVVGDWSGGVGSAGPTGSIFVFEKNAGGADNWGTTASLTSSDGRPYDAFGISVSVSGSTIISGASADDIEGTAEIGSSYFFADTGGGWVQRAKQVPPLPTDCGTNDNYGYSVAIEGNTAVIGAPYDDVGIKQDQGSVYILERDEGGANNWGLVKVLSASDGAANAAFGFSVAIKNGAILVGAWQAPVGENQFQGAAYIFERDLGGPNYWGEAKKITASDGGPVDAFGGSVALDNDTAVVGAPYADVGSNTDQGSAYVFSRNAGGPNNWGQTKKLVASDGAPSSGFGFPVSISGSTIVVGSPLADIGANQDQGAAYLYERNAGGANNWGEVRKLTAPDGEAGDQFSDYAVTVRGDTIVIGAWLDDVDGRADQGSAHIFYRNAGGSENWGYVKKIVASDGAAGDFFGHAAAISSDTVVIGAPWDDVGANQNQGSAYVFARNSGGAENWGQVARLSDASGGAGDNFGNAVASSGDDFLIGAHLATINQALTQHRSDATLLPPVVQGAAYVFHGTALAPTAAGVSVSGQVLSGNLQGVSGARVTLAAPNGETRSAITNALGYFRFDDIPVGQTYIASVSHKRYQFDPQTITVLDEIQDLNFTAQSGQAQSVLPRFSTSR